jgi:hypothetical protein
LQELFGNDALEQSQVDLLNGSTKEKSIWESEWTPEENDQIKHILLPFESKFDRIDLLPERPIARISASASPDELLAMATLDHQINLWSNGLRQSARLAFDQNHPALGLHRVCEMVKLGNTIGSLASYGAQFGQLQSRFAGLASVELFEPKFNLQDPAQAQEARHLAILLLNDADLDHLYLCAWIDGSLRATDPHDYSHDPSWWSEPWRDDGLSRMLEHAASAAPAFFTDNYQDAKIFLSRYPERLPPRKSDLDILLDQIEFDISASPDMPVYFESKSAARAAAILLSANLYKARTGAFPANAAALVPIELPQIPRDPMAAHGTFRYRLDPGGPTVWSVGRDGVDDGGIVRFDKSGKKLYRFRQLDEVYGAAWRDSRPVPSALTAPAP